MKIYEYASDKYGRIPNYIETGALYPGMIADGSTVSGISNQSTVNPPATQ